MNDAGHELAGTVVDGAFEQRLADSLREAAMDLAFDDSIGLISRPKSSAATKLTKEVLPVPESTSSSQI